MHPQWVINTEPSGFVPSFMSKNTHNSSASASARCVQPTSAYGSVILIIRPKNPSRLEDSDFYRIT